MTLECPFPEKVRFATRKDAKVVRNRYKPRMGIYSCGEGWMTHYHLGHQGGKDREWHRNTHQMNS